MRKEVWLQGGARSVLVIFACFTFMLSFCAVSAVVITPQQVVVDDHATPQEFVVTVVNDGFSPLAGDVRFEYLSSYLQEYIEVKPAEFIISPSEQQNLIVSARFPEELPPQPHRIVVYPVGGVDEPFIIEVRPEGDSVERLQLRGLEYELSDDAMVVTATVELVNFGNVFLFVTPELFLRKDGLVVKNLTYKRPLIIGPGQSYPLTLRHDNTGLSSGRYVLVVRAQFHGGLDLSTTDEQTASFIIPPRLVDEDEKSYWWFIVASLASLFLIVFGVYRLWFFKSKKRYGSNRLGALEFRVRDFEKEFSGFSEEVSSFVDEAHEFMKKREDDS